MQNFDHANITLNTSSTYIFKRSLLYFKPYIPHIILGIVVMTFAGLCDAAIAWLVKPAMDDIFINKDETMLLLIPAAFVGITLVKASGRLLQNYLMHYSGLKVLEVIRDELYRKVTMLPLRFYEGARIGVLMSLITGDVVAIRDSMPAVVMMIRQVITMASLLFVVFYQNAALAFWAVIVLPLAMLPFIYFGKRMRRLSRESRAKGAEVNSLLQETLSGIRVVKAFATEPEETRRFDRANKRILRLGLKSVLAGEFSSSSMELVGAIGISLVLGFGGMQVIRGESTPGTFFSFVAALVMLYEPVKKITTANNDIQRALAGADRVFAILDNPAIVEESGGSTSVPLPLREVRFENVSFAYREDANALEDINFTLPHGQRIALVGPSGAGKTTLVNLLPRFYDPSSGRIFWNGVALPELSLPDLRRHISLVSQEAFLFNLSVRDNIAYGTSGLSDADIVAAAKAAYAYDFIMEMPEGFDTVIGERGVKLSGGQKQRLTIARALAKNAPLLILDEATSALDSESERVVQQALDNLMHNRTSIVIAHRLSTVLESDRILVMDRGRILASGPHAELMESSPLYSKLYAMQFNV